jgi:hypothetical protein
MQYRHQQWHSQHGVVLLEAQIQNTAQHSLFLHTVSLQLNPVFSLNDPTDLQSVVDACSVWLLSSESSCSTFGSKLLLEPDVCFAVLVVRLLNRTLASMFTSWRPRTPRRLAFNLLLLVCVFFLCHFISQLQLLGDWTLCGAHTWGKWVGCRHLNFRERFAIISCVSSVQAPAPTELQVDVKSVLTVGTDSPEITCGSAFAVKIHITNNSKQPMDLHLQYDPKVVMIAWWPLNYDHSLTARGTLDFSLMVWAAWLALFPTASRLFDAVF